MLKRFIFKSINISRETDRVQKKEKEHMETRPESYLRFLVSVTLKTNTEMKSHSTCQKKKRVLMKKETLQYHYLDNRLFTTQRRSSKTSKYITIT